MKASVIDRFGPPEVLTIREVPDPKVGPGEVIIRVDACGINRYDLYMRMGAVFTDLAFPHVLGADVAGRVEEVGAQVTGFAVGDRVIAAPGFPQEPADWDVVPENHATSFEVTGTHAWGGYAELLRMPARFVLPDKTGLAPQDVAAMPLVLMTAFNAVEHLGEVRAGSSVLVQGGASGSGNACVQVAKALGARVVTTVGSEPKVATAKAAGADLVINYNEENFADRVLEFTEGVGVDVVIDNVGGSVFADNLKALRPGGIFVNFGLVGGMTAPLNFRDLFFKRHQLRGSFMGSMEGLRKGLAMLAEGRVKAVVDRTFPLHDAAIAHAYIESRAVRGKVVLLP